VYGNNRQQHSCRCCIALTNTKSAWTSSLQ